MSQSIVAEVKKETLLCHPRYLVFATVKAFMAAIEWMRSLLCCKRCCKRGHKSFNVIFAVFTDKWLYLRLRFTAELERGGHTDGSVIDKIEIIYSQFLTRLDFFIPTIFSLKNERCSISFYIRLTSLVGHFSTSGFISSKTNLLFHISLFFLFTRICTCWWASYYRVWVVQMQLVLELLWTKEYRQLREWPPTLY